jgi:hypothetical protein
LGYHHEFDAADLGQAANDRRIVSKKPIAAELLKLFAQIFDVIDSFGPCRVAADSDTFPGSQIGVDFLSSDRPVFSQV